MTKDSKNIVLGYYTLHVMLSIIFWLVFTTNHPLRAVSPLLLRQGVSVFVLILIYFCFGYLAMLVRSHFLKNPFIAVKSMLMIFGINTISAITVIMTHSVLSLSWLSIVARMLNYPAFLFLFIDHMMLLNGLIIALIPPLAYLIGLLLRQIYY